MKKLIVLFPFILIGCSSSQKERNKQDADSLEKALIIIKTKHEMEIINIQAETDSLLLQAKMKEAKGN